jgi:hypothetical protein
VLDAEFVPSKEQLEKVIKILENHELINLKDSDMSSNIFEQVQTYKSVELDINLPKISHFWHSLFELHEVNFYDIMDPPTMGVTEFDIFSMNDWLEHGTRYIIIWQNIDQLFYKDIFGQHGDPDREINNAIERFYKKYNLLIQDLENVLSRKIKLEWMVQ